MKRIPFLLDLMHRFPLASFIFMYSNPMRAPSSASLCRWGSGSWVIWLPLQSFWVAGRMWVWVGWLRRPRCWPRCWLLLPTPSQVSYMCISGACFFSHNSIFFFHSDRKWLQSTICMYDNWPVSPIAGFGGCFMFWLWILYFYEITYFCYELGKELSEDQRKF